MAETISKEQGQDLIDSAFERCGIAAEYRSLGFFNVEQGPDGLTYPIPIIMVDGKPYQLTKRGAVISQDATVFGSKAIGARTVVKPYAYVDDAKIGPRCVIESHAVVSEDVEILSNTIVEAYAKIGRMAFIGHG